MHRPMPPRKSPVSGTPQGRRHRGREWSSIREGNTEFQNRKLPLSRDDNGLSISDREYRRELGRVWSFYQRNNTTEGPFGKPVR